MQKRKAHRLSVEDYRHLAQGLEVRTASVPDQYARGLVSMWRKRNQRPIIPSVPRKDGKKSLSEPQYPPEELHVANFCWEFAGETGAFRTAAETGHRIDQIARTIQGGNNPVRAIAFGKEDWSDLVIALAHPAERNVFERSVLFRNIVEATNEGLKSDRVLLRLAIPRN